MEGATKVRILDEALSSFAENGYKGTNLRDLAARLGLSKSALYKHYESKEAIWNAVIETMESYYKEHIASPEIIPQIPSSAEEFYEMTVKMINFTVHDRRVILTRRLLLAEQFRDERVCSLATSHFLTGRIELYKKVFIDMMERGIVKKEDPEMLAFVFTSPITALIHYCDREPDKEPLIMKQTEDFINYFIKLYFV